MTISGSAEGVCASCWTNDVFSGLCTAVRRLTGPSAHKAAPWTEASHQFLRLEAALCNHAVEMGEAKRKFRLKDVTTAEGGK